MSSRTSPAKPTRGFSYWILAAILVFSPLPFGSVGAVWSDLYGVLIGMGLIAYVIERWRAHRQIPAMPPMLLAAAALVVLVALWGYVQSIPGLFPSLQHPFWAQTAALLQLPEMKGALSLAPEQSARVATRYLAYLGFAVLVIWHSRRPSNADLLIKIFIGAQAVYALYGLTLYFSGAETILWFDRPGASAVVTSTFINRNNYAAYAGLGALAASVLVLRYLRRTLAEDISHRTRLSKTIETLTSTGWLLLVTLALLIVSVLLSQSRMGFFAILVASAVMLGSWAARLPQGQVKNLGIALLVLLIGFLSINFFLSGDATMDRLSRFFEQGDVRFQEYPRVLEAISERPWLGYGLGSFDTAFRAFRIESSTALFSRAHSDYLELAMDLGWPAALAMILALVLPFLAAWQGSRTLRDYELALLSVAGTVQIGVHSATDFSLQIPAVAFAYLFVAMVGLGALLGRKSERHAEAAAPGLAPSPEASSQGAR